MWKPRNTLHRSEQRILYTEVFLNVFFLWLYPLVLVHNDLLLKKLKSSCSLFSSYYIHLQILHIKPIFRDDTGEFCFASLYFYSSRVFPASVQLAPINRHFCKVSMRLSKYVPLKLIWGSLVPLPNIVSFLHGKTEIGQRGTFYIWRRGDLD